MAAISLSTYTGRRTPALYLLLALRAVTKKADTLYKYLGYICGLELLLLGFFITYQVVARNLGWPRAPGTDAMSGYILGMAATWGLAYALRSDANVRIDVLLPRMGPRLRAIADFVAIMGIAFLAYVVTWKLWGDVITSYQQNHYSNDSPRTPLFFPKAIIAVGYTLLLVSTFQMMLSSLAEAWLPRIHKAMGGNDISHEDLGEGLTTASPPPPPITQDGSR